MSLKKTPELLCIQAYKNLTLTTREVLFELEVSKRRKLGVIQNYIRGNCVIIKKTDIPLSNLTLPVGGVPHNSRIFFYYNDLSICKKKVK